METKRPRPTKQSRHRGLTGRRCGPISTDRGESAVGRHTLCPADITANETAKGLAAAQLAGCATRRLQKQAAAEKACDERKIEKIISRSSRPVWRGKDTEKTGCPLSSHPCNGPWRSRLGTTGQQLFRGWEEHSKSRSAFELQFGKAVRERHMSGSSKCAFSLRILLGVFTLGLWRTATFLPSRGYRRLPLELESAQTNRTTVEG